MLTTSKNENRLLMSSYVLSLRETKNFSTKFCSTKHWKKKQTPYSDYHQDCFLMFFCDWISFWWRPPISILSLKNFRWADIPNFLHLCPTPIVFDVQVSVGDIYVSDACYCMKRTKLVYSSLFGYIRPDLRSVPTFWDWICYNYWTFIRWFFDWFKSFSTWVTNDHVRNWFLYFGSP